MKSLVLTLMTQLYGLVAVIHTDSPDRPHLSSPSNLSCYSCSTIDDIKCKVINETNYYSTNRYSPYSTRLYGSECSSGEQFCAVLRLDTKIEQSAIDYKFWAIERKCVNDCVDGCFVLGERTKLSLCTTCCTTDYCNIGNNGNSLSCFNNFLCLFFLLYLLFVNKSIL